MRILILATIPFDGLRRRQQQVALGLAGRGHEVLYLEPPRPVRSLVDPARFEPEEIPPADPADASASPPGSADSPVAPVACEVWASVARQAELRGAAPHLTLARKGVGMAKMGAWGWAARVGWRMWAGQVRRMIAGAPADVALVYHPALIAPARAALECPVVFECLDDFPSLVPSSAIATAYDRALRSGLPLVDGLLAVNRYLTESWGRFLGEGIPVRVIEHGVDLSLFQPVTPSLRMQARRTLELPTDSPVAVYLGRFDARISYADLELIFDRAPQLQLILLGEVSSEGRDILLRLPQERIQHVGPLRPSQAAELIAAADLALLPLRREPHLEPIRGLKLYEYLATGLPVLASFRRAVKAFRDTLYLYSDAADLEAGLQAALAEVPDAEIRAERIRVARENGWEVRIAEIEEFLTTLATSAGASDA